MLLQDNTVHKTVYAVEHIICLLHLKVEKIMRVRMIVFYIIGMSMKTLINNLFVISTDSIKK
jgi:hypothetical protein